MTTYARCRAGDILFDGSCYDPVSGAVFGSTAQVTSGSQQLYKWPNPADPATFVRGNLFSTTTSALAWDPVSYVVWATAKSSTRTALISRSDQYTLAATTVVNQVVGTVGKHLSGNSPLATDGTHLYYGASMTDENSWVYKFRCSDGVQVAAIQLPNQPGGAATSYLNSIVLGGDGFVYVGGGFIAVGFAARLPVDLSTATVITTGLAVNDDDSVVTPGFFWLGDENSPTLAKVATDLSAVTLVNVGKGLSIDGIYYDGQYVWAGIVDPTIPSPNDFSSIIVAVDPSSGAVVAEYDLLGTADDPHTNVNEIVRVPTGLWSCSYQVTGFDSWIAFTPLVLFTQALTPMSPAGALRT